MSVTEKQHQELEELKYICLVDHSEALADHLLMDHSEGGFSDPYIDNVDHFYFWLNIRSSLFSLRDSLLSNSSVDSGSVGQVLLCQAKCDEYLLHYSDFDKWEDLYRYLVEEGYYSDTDSFSSSVSEKVGISYCFELHPECDHDKLELLFRSLQENGLISNLQNEAIQILSSETSNKIEWKSTQRELFLLVLILSREGFIKNYEGRKRDDAIISVFRLKDKSPNRKSISKEYSAISNDYPTKRDNFLKSIFFKL